MSMRNPEVSLNIIPAKLIAAVSGQRALIVGQMTAAATEPDGVLVRDFPNDNSEDAAFGINSHLAGLIRDFKADNKITPLDILPLDDAAGTAATAIITLTVGPATADTTFYVTIGSTTKYRRAVTVAVDDTITAIGDAIAAAFTGSDAQMPFTVANNAGVVTATALNLGTLANNWGISIEGGIPAVTVVITGWTGGATDPTLTTILDAIGDTRYQTILWPSSYDLSVVQALLDARFNSTNAVRDGIVNQVKVDTLANLKAYAIQNSQSVVVWGQKVIDDAFYKGPATLEMADNAAAQICAIRALRMTEGASLSEYLSTVAAADQFGGMEIASLPYFNTALPGLSVATADHQFSDTDLAELEAAGVATFGPNQVFNTTIFGPAVTTYLTDSAGNPDESYKYLNTIDTASAVREFFFANIKSRFAQSRLTEGDLIARRDIANESLIRVFCKRLYGILAEAALTQSGSAAAQDFDDNLSIIIDIQTGTVTIDSAPLLVGQLRVVLGTIQINFGS